MLIVLHQDRSASGSPSEERGKSRRVLPRLRTIRPSFCECYQHRRKCAAVTPGRTVAPLLAFSEDVFESIERVSNRKPDFARSPNRGRGGGGMSSAVTEAVAESSSTGVSEDENTRTPRTFRSADCYALRRSLPSNRMPKSGLSADSSARRFRPRVGPRWSQARSAERRLYLRRRCLCLIALRSGACGASRRGRRPLRLPSSAVPSLCWFDFGFDAPKVRGDRCYWR